LGASDVPGAERAEIRRQRWRAVNYQHGGEPRGDTVDIETMWEVHRCFIGEEGRKAGREQLDAYVDRLKAMNGVEIAGFAFDYIGYANYRGCYHPDCLALYEHHLRNNDLPDTPANRDAFSLKELVAYSNAMVDHVKSINPDWKVKSHVYPLYMPEPLYGNRLNVDYCGQTVAWHFLWPEEKIRHYANVVVRDQNKYFEHVRGVPFIGFGNPEDFDLKTPEIFERELKAILNSGAEFLMLHTFGTLVEYPEIVAVLQKFSSSSP
jgi:hypothetical protein